MSRARRAHWGTLFGIVVLGLLLQAAPGQAQPQMSCTFCRWVPCPDAPSTACTDFSDNVITCYDWGICFPVENGFKSSRLDASSLHTPTGNILTLRAALCSATFPPQQKAFPGFSAR
jgi:hypothetical protein